MHFLHCGLFDFFLFFCLCSSADVKPSDYLVISSLCLIISLNFKDIVVT